MNRTERIAYLRDKIRDYQDHIETLQLQIRHMQERCPHPEASVKRWTNDDGDGQFTVERCEACGMQRDGGLQRT